MAAILPLGVSASGYSQDATRNAVLPAAPVMRVHIMRPASGLAGASRAHGLVRPRVARPDLTPVNTGSGIVYTCDPNVGSATCNYLNTTIAGYYNSVFTNANANIYVQYGTTGLGESQTYYNFASYTQYVAALNANLSQSPIQVSALAALNEYDATPYGSDEVSITVALGMTLGFTGMTGATASLGACTAGTAGCYNGIITVIDDPEDYGFELYYDNLGGTEPADAYDFYAVVEHETDEVLGTPSCIDTQNDPLTDDCDAVVGGTGNPSAADLFRYSSVGTLELDSSLSTTPGAYFSFDGGVENGANGVAGAGKVYNTLDNGDDYADFVSSYPDCGTDEAIQDAEGCPGEDAGLTILNDGGGEINILQAVGFNVPAQDTQTINFPVIASQTAATTLDLSATASSGLAITFASVSTSVCTVSGSTASFISYGHCTIQASQAGDFPWAPAAPVTQTFTVGHHTQTISFTTITGSHVAATTLNLSATASSGLPVSFVSASPAVCTVSGAQVSLIAFGLCSIQAMQGGNDEYFGATTVTQDFGVGHASQTISFPAIGSHVAATNLSLNATATSGLAVTFASATPSICTVSGTTASLIAEGFCYINASQAGNGEYFEAPTVGQQFGVGHATQTINFPAIGARTAATTLNLSATASSGLPVTFTSTTPSVCTVSGSTAALVAFGTCAITASQAGNNASGHSEYFAASVTQKFSVAHASQTITFPTITTQYLYMPLTLVATASSGLPVSFISINTATCTVSGNVATMLESESYCDIEALQSGNNEYLGAPSVTQRFFINIK